MAGLESSGENNGLQNSVLTCHGRYTTPTYRHIHAQEGIRTSYMQDGEVTRVKLSQTLMHLALRHYENCRIWAMILHPSWPWEVQVRRQERTGWCCSSDGFSSTTGSTFWSADEVSIFFWFTVFHVVVIQLDNIVGSQLMKISLSRARSGFHRHCWVFLCQLRFLGRQYVNVSCCMQICFTKGLFSEIISV